MIVYMNLCKTKGVLGSWKLWFSYINENKKKQIKISARFRPIFGFELNEKRSRAKPSWKSFSSSYGSSQLGSDSSLVNNTLESQSWTKIKSDVSCSTLAFSTKFMWLIKHFCANLLIPCVWYSYLIIQHQVGRFGYQFENKYFNCAYTIQI